MAILMPLAVLTLAAVSLTACATIQLTSDQTTRLAQLQAFADQIAQDWGSVTVEARTHHGLILLSPRLGADRPMYVQRWMLFSHRVVIHPELLSTKWCAEWTVAHGLEWARRGYAGTTVYAPIWALPLVLAAEALGKERAEKERENIAAEARGRLQNVRQWTETEFLNSITECRVVISRLREQEKEK